MMYVLIVRLCRAIRMRQVRRRNIRIQHRWATTIERSTPRARSLESSPSDASRVHLLSAVIGIVSTDALVKRAVLLQRWLVCWRLCPQSCLLSMDQAFYGFIVRDPSLACYRLHALALKGRLLCRAVRLRRVCGRKSMPPKVSAST